MKSLAFVRDVTWAEVLETWSTTEKGIWDALFHERGFATWEAWRMSYFSKENIDPAAFDWKCYRVDKPEETVPQFFVGPFKGWQQHLPAGEDCGRFADIAKSPRLRENRKVTDILAQFPSPTTFMGVHHGNEVALFEGTHRAAAIALAADEGREVARELSVALAEVDPTTFHLAHRQLK